MPAGSRLAAGWARTLALAALLATSFALPAFADIETIVVTAEKRSEDIQTVPISLTAFTSVDLAVRQLRSFRDLQFSTPGVTYSKNNFTASDFTIRGIGDTAIGDMADTSVAINVNDVYILDPQLAESEYFDIDRVEILRGPQSTLYGRGATGGTVNVITAKPNLEAFAANIEGEYGNYDEKTVRGMVNIPIVDDKLGLRLAGIYFNRDGTTKNLFTNTDIDGRNQYGLRASIRFAPVEGTTIDLVAQYSKDDSTRTRSQRTACHYDPSGILGCLPDKLANETSNELSDFQSLLTSNVVLGPVLSLYNIAAPPPTTAVPSDFHQVLASFNPRYTAHENFVNLQWQQTVNDWLDMTLVAGHVEDSNRSLGDYNNGIGSTLALSSLQRAALAAVAPINYSLFLAPSSPCGGLFPVSAFDRSNSGIIGGNILECTDHAVAIDRSEIMTTQDSGEVRFRTHFDGPWNFLLAGYYLHARSLNDYWVSTPVADYFAVVAPAALSAGALDGVAFGPPQYRNDTARYDLNSTGIFGETYYEAIPDTLKFTIGARWTNDQKTALSRTTLLNVFVPVGTDNLDSPIPYLSTAPIGPPSFQTPAPFQTQSVHNSALTGRAVADWTPKLAFTDATLVYLSYQRGYRAGGANPPLPPDVPPGTPQLFKPEFIDAFELGTKNTLLDGTLQADLDVWYYKYKDLQVSSIVNKTSINENINARLWGSEAELLWAPSDRWQFDLNASHINSDIGDASLVDTRDPTGGNPNVLLVKDIQNASNCVISVAPGLPAPIAAAAQSALPALVSVPAAVPGFANPAGFGSCSANSQGVPLFDLSSLPSPLTPADFRVSTGVPVTLKGNELPNAPDWSFGIGAQYTQPLDNGYSLSPRIDLYWQTHTWGRIFNRDPIDKIAGYTMVNAQLQLNAPDNKWYARVFVKNAFDQQYVTGMYVSDAVTGLFTNEFVGAPRTFGVALGASL